MTTRCLFFASLSKLSGSRELEVEMPEGATVADLLQHLEERFPTLLEYARRYQIAVNEELVPADFPLSEGAEVALLPAVSGGTEDLVRLDESEISLDLLMAAVRRKDCGAVVFFLGTVRDEESKVDKIDYSSYQGMARKEMVALVAELRTRYEVGSVALWHRLGMVAAGEASVAVAVSSKHRPQAFEAARFLIDSLKARVPIWKREIGADGEVWIEGDARVPG